MKIVAYPVGGEDLFINPPHNIQEWLKAMRYIYAYINKGMDKTKAIDLITKNWDKMTTIDFKNWLNFYESGAGSAYKQAELSKKAQYFPTTFLDENDLKAELPGMPSKYQDLEEIEAPVINKQTEKQKSDEKERIEKEQAAQLIKALIGRFNSAERLAVSEGIARILGPNYENWLRALHELKKEIQVAPFRNLKSELITDLIIRKGNQLYAGGDPKSAKIMYKFAQIAPPPLEGTDKPVEPMPDPAISDTSTTPPLTDGPTPDLNAEPNKLSDKDDWVKEFLDGLEGIVDDKNEVMDASADLYVSEDDLKVFAQEVPAEVPLAGTSAPGADITQAIPVPEGNKLDQALAGITVEDVIAKLEAVSNIFKNREISRQLAMVDVMMDQLGIASYFTELGESISKSLEANQYCATRVEDVLGRLKGSVNVPAEHAVDLEGIKPGAAEGNATGLKNQLELEKQKTDARKKSREDLANKTEDAAIANPQNAIPEVNTEALNQPAQVQAPINPGIRP